MKANRFADASRKRAPRRTLTLSTAAGALFLSGCGMTTHFHNEKLATLATDLQTEFGAYRADQPSLYATMTANVAAFADEEEALLDRMADNVEAALLTKAPTMTFAEYDNRLKVKRAALTLLKTEGSEALRKDFEARGKALSDIKDLDAEIARIKAEIKAAEAEEKKWTATIADLQDAMAKLPAVLEKLSVRETGIDAIRNTLTGDDKDTAGLRDRLIEAAEGKLADAPGIAVRILQLGLELAELKKEAVELALISIQERRKIYEDFAASISVADVLLQKTKQHLELAEIGDSSSPATGVINEKLRPSKSSNNAGQKAADLQNDLRLLILVPRLAISAESLITRQGGLIALRLARQRHLDSISGSAIGDRAHQALIASGIDALVAYHSGGVTDEDVANLIRVAQGLALFIIAA